MAQGKFDLEKVLSGIQQLLAAKLNAKLSEIDAEKNDGVTLTQIDSAAYVFQSLDRAPAQFTTFVLYGVENIDSNGIGGSTLKSYAVSVLIIVADPGTDTDIPKKILRYLRALEEVAEENFRGGLAQGDVTVKSLQPVPFNYKAADYMATGVSLQIALG